VSGSSATVIAGALPQARTQQLHKRREIPDADWQTTTARRRGRSWPSFNQLDSANL
jgi:hypothetical protein